MDNYREPTPATLRGARVIDTDEAHRLWLAKAAVFIDAMPRVPKPANLPAGTIWRDQPRFNIPGSAWLVDVGYGAISSERDAYFRRWLQKLTRGDKGRAVVFYCKAACWMSWNAAKRAIEEYGYTNVLWYPEGTDGWEAHLLDLEQDEPEPPLSDARSDASMTHSR
jgi:PQQ-dependent catabolism-associated CXXCW motif protein